MAFNKENFNMQFANVLNEHYPSTDPPPVHVGPPGPWWVEIVWAFRLINPESETSDILWKRSHSHGSPAGFETLSDAWIYWRSHATAEQARDDAEEDLIERSFRVRFVYSPNAEPPKVELRTRVYSIADEPL